MHLKNYNAFAIAIVSLPIFIFSCRKNDKIPGEPGGTTPNVETPGDPPVYLAYKVNDNESLNLSFKYEEYPDKVSVYYDDTLTTDKYDHIFATYSFNKSGYLTENAFYDLSGNPKSKITIVRESDIINRVLVEHSNSGTLKTDTFNVAFSDSTGSSGYRFMTVNYGKYFSGIPVTMRFTYNDNRLMNSTGGLFTSGDNAIFFPSVECNYGSLNRLNSKMADLYYGTQYSYENETSGLDSLFRVLGGKDWSYLENVLNYDENTSIFFYPLYITLSKGNVDLDIYLHRYGPLAEVRSIPNGIDYSDVEIFNFTNSFDTNKKLTKTTIYNNDQEYASYQFQY